VEVVASLSQGRTAAAQCGLCTYKSVPVIFEPPCTYILVDGVLELTEMVVACTASGLRQTSQKRQ